jgi:hypothetical protein
LLAARGAIGESSGSVRRMAFSYHIVQRLSASIACSSTAGLHKRNPAFLPFIRDGIDFQGKFGWHPACMHFQP